MEKPTDNSTKKRSRKSAAKPADPLHRSGEAKSTPNASSKQERVITMLQSAAGTTIAAMMKATGWQQHSVRGFLAGVVRKKLKLKLDSKKVDGTRIYRIGGAVPVKTSSSRSKRAD